MDERKQREIFAKNLNTLLEERELTQREVADKIGVLPQTFNTWCQGIAIPRMGKVQVLADYFGINKSDLIDDVTPNPRVTKGIRIPVLGTVHAGIPIDAVQDIIDYEEITPQLASSGDFFALQIKGDCMTPKITEGDVIIVRCQNDADSGDIVVATVNGEEAVVRKLQKYENGIALVPINPSYDSIRFSAEEIETLPVEIIGKAVELRAKL